MSLSKKVIDEVSYGVYVWQMPDGRWIGDEAGHFLSISSMRGDKKRIKELRDVVLSYGIDSGQALFLSGHRKIDDDEYERQRLRMQFGLLPDDHDIPALTQEQEYHQKYG